MPTPDFIFREMGIDERPPVGERGEEPIPKKLSFSAKVLRFVSEVIEGAHRGIPIYPKAGYPGWEESPLPTSIEPASEAAGIQAPEVAKHMLGTMLADAGVKLQPKFLKVLEGVRVAPGTYGEAGGYASQAGIGLPALEPSKPIGYPGPDYSVYAKQTGWVFLHESLHRFDELLPEKKKQKIWAAVLGHFDEISPRAAAWLRQTKAGKNPERAPAEALADALTNYLFYHEQWPEEMDALMDDYFKFE